MPHPSRIQPSLVTLVPPCTGVLRRVYNTVTSMLCQALVEGPPWSRFSTSAPYTVCNSQIALIADGNVVHDGAEPASPVTHMDCPCAGHNLKRAFQKSLLLHAIIYFMLFIFSAHLLLGANNMREPLPESLLAAVHFMRLHS